MQDSIEDYIKISKNSKEDLAQVSKEVQISAQRKKECEMRAMKIVEFSIEGKLLPEIFMRCLPFINEAYYQDIVEERAMTKLCGYSICGMKIPEMPKKQYYISVKCNKVYDITDRKNYCSNFCYKASLHIKKQLDNSPLWLRKLEDTHKTYQLLDHTEGGLPGEYIDQGIIKSTVEPSFTSISSFTEVSLDDMVEKEIGRTRFKSAKTKGYEKEIKTKNVPKSTMKTIIESQEQATDEEKVVETLSRHTDDMCTTTEVVDTNVINKDVSKTDAKHGMDNHAKESNESYVESKIKSSKKGIKKKMVDIEVVIQRAFKSWLTLETYIFIHGEVKVKEILNEKKLSDCFEQLNITNLQREQQMKYLNICRRLQLQEIADEKFDNSLIGTELKPPPNYKQLKEENKDLTLKVKSFYSGMLHEKEDTNFPTKTSSKTGASSEEGSPAVLPLVDVTSQNALRRKVYLSSINKPMQLLLQALRVPHYSSVLSDVQSLVKTFNLKADNVIFKPIVWNYIAIALLFILALQDKRIENVLQERQSQTYLELQFSTLPNRNKFIENVMAAVQNMESFLEYYIS